MDTKQDGLVDEEELAAWLRGLAPEVVEALLKMLEAPEAFPPHVDVNLVLHPPPPPPEREPVEMEGGTFLNVLKGMAQYKERFIYPQGWKSATQALVQQLRRDEALKLLTRETEARFDPALQAKLTLDNRKNLALINQMQYGVLAEFGYEPTAENIKLLHAQRYYYRDDPEFAAKSVYVRLNTRRQGDLVQGVSAAPDVPLHHLDPAGRASCESLHGFCRPGRPLIVVAGSLT